MYSWEVAFKINITFFWNVRKSICHNSQVLADILWCVWNIVGFHLRYIQQERSLGITRTTPAPALPTCPYTRHCACYFLCLRLSASKWEAKGSTSLRCPLRVSEFLKAEGAGTRLSAVGAAGRLAFHRYTHTAVTATGGSSATSPRSKVSAEIRQVPGLLAR